MREIFHARYYKGICNNWKNHKPRKIRASERSILYALANGKSCDLDLAASLRYNKLEEQGSFGQHNENQLRKLLDNKIVFTIGDLVEHCMLSWRTVWKTVNFLIENGVLVESHGSAEVFLRSVIEDGKLCNKVGYRIDTDKLSYYPEK